MTLRHKDLIVDPDKPFLNCKLGRELYANVLTSIVENYADGFVMAINNKWGDGKTTFIKMWQKKLENLDFKTIYFNAWENDFEDNPLIALLGELKAELSEDTQDEKFYSLVRKAAVFGRNLLPTLTKAAVAKYLDTDILSELAEKSTEAATEIFQEEVDKYANRKAGIEEFKQKLNEYLAEHANGKSLIFFIDELDRCRPRYAVEVLENIKHLFNVKGVIFVLSIDKEQLGHAVRGVYGSEQMEADEYLRRFIDLEFNLPKGEGNGFWFHLYKYFEYNNYFESVARTGLHAEDEKNTFKTFGAFLFERGGLTLRQQEKIASHARVVLKTFEYNTYVFPNLFLFLIYLFHLKPDEFKKIKDKRLRLHELQDMMLSVFSNNYDYNEKSILTQLEAEFIYRYNISLGNDLKQKLVHSDPATGKETALINSRFADKDNNWFSSIIISKQRTYGNLVSLQHLLDRISLTESFKT